MHSRQPATSALTELNCDPRLQVLVLTTRRHDCDWAGCRAATAPNGRTRMVSGAEHRRHGWSFVPASSGWAEVARARAIAAVLEGTQAVKALADRRVRRCARRSVSPCAARWRARINTRPARRRRMPRFGREQRLAGDAPATAPRAAAIWRQSRPGHRATKAGPGTSQPAMSTGQLLRNACWSRTCFSLAPPGQAPIRAPSADPGRLLRARPPRDGEPPRTSRDLVGAEFRRS